MGTVMQQILIDKHGRTMKKLRVSLLDACNFRCVYCMPEDATFASKSERIPVQELGKIVKNLVTLGIDEIRITGGEPTLSPDFMSVIREFSHLPLEKLSITTNGLNIAKYYGDLRNAGVYSLNFSLDTLKKDRFKFITKVDGLNKVLQAIDLAREYGFKIKINCVVMRNTNDDEVLDFIKFSKDKDVEVRFLETMNIGVVKPHFDRWFISAQDMIDTIEKHYEMERLQDPVDSTSFNFKLNNGASIGFIASESKPFCGGCSRLRLDAQGVIHPCLFKNDGINLTGIALEEYSNLMPTLIARKPLTRIKQQDTPMYRLGG
jgi:cyclic pyranopterin phosphate synthase